MSLLTKPTALTAASRIVYTLLNTLYTDLYDKIGNTGNGRGTLTWENLAANAALEHTQVLNTAAVLGGGALQEMSNKFRQTYPAYLESAANRSAVTADNSTLAVEVGKLIQRISRSAAVNLDTITGGANGDVIIISADVTAGSVTYVHTEDATVNMIRTKTAANVTVSGNHMRMFMRSDVDGTSMWYEL